MNTGELNAMTFGEDRAKHLGVNVERRKLIILIAGSILTGAAVAVSGTIGFVGLVVPHFIRQIWGPDHKHLLPLSIFIGGGFLILTDLVARTIIAPHELPIGVITSLIGAPAFAFILLQRRKRREKIRCLTLQNYQVDIIIKRSWTLSLFKSIKANSLGF